MSEIVPGMWFVGTPGHGGIKLDRERNAAMPDYMRRQGGWYEEDCEWALVFAVFERELLDKGNDYNRRAILDGTARDTFRHWFPDQFERFTGESIDPGQSYKRDEELFRQAHANDWVVVSATCEGDSVRCTATLGGGRETGRPTSVWLVPKAEYEPWPHGFVIDPARHVRVEEVRR